MNEAAQFVEPNPGDVLLNSYYYDSEKKLAVGEDSVAQRTTFRMNPYQKFYGSVSAIISAHNEQKFNAACRKKR